MRSLVMVVFLAATACGSPPRRPHQAPVPTPPSGLGCSAASCEGCCLDGVCIDSPTNALCGAGGAACFACADGELCGAARVCERFQPGGTTDAAGCPLVLLPLELSVSRPLTSVWSSPERTWAAGPLGAVVLEDEAFVAPPNDAAIGTNLRAVWSSGESRESVWFLRQGTGAAIHRELEGLGLDLPSPLHGEVLAIWGRADDDVFVGGEGQGGAGELAHWDGAGWRVVQTTAARVIALAGYGKTLGYAATETELLLEQNGVFLPVGATPARFSGGIAVTGDREVWGAGEDGRLHHWQDGTWTSSAVSRLPLTSVWPQTRRSVFVPHPTGGVALFDGNSTIFVPVGAQLTAMHGTSMHAVAVGETGGMLARCAKEGEIPDGHVGSGGYPGGGGSGGTAHQCVTVCSGWTPVNGGCAVQSTVCF